MAVTDYGKPLAPLDLPEPPIPPGFALLQVLTCGVCFSDVKTSRGHMPFSDRLSLPHVPGHEVFGEVLETNPPGMVKAGSRAVVFHYWPCGNCSACRRGTEGLCTDLVGWMGFTHPGGFQERLAVPVDRLIPVPPAVDPVHGAPMSCALGTAYRSTITRGGVRPGARVGVVGLGGVGIHAAQIAAAAGAGVVGFELHEPTLAAARDLGIDARRPDDPDAEAAVMQETGGEGLDVVIDAVGHADTLALSDRLVRQGGRVVGVGYSPSSELTVPSTRLVLGEVEYVGSRYASRQDMGRAVALVAGGRVQTVVGMVRPLDQVNEVFQALESGDVVGRAVLEVIG